MTEDKETRRPSVGAALRLSGAASALLKSSAWRFSAATSALTVIIVAIAVPSTRNWFLIPVWLCGLLVLPDAWAALTGRRDLFDPQSLVGLFGIHFFFLAPLLHFILDYWPLHVAPAQDWHTSFGVLSTLNVVGLIGYRIVLHRLPKDPNHESDARDPEREARAFVPLGLIASAVGFLTFIAVVVRFDGLGGYVDTVTSRDTRVELAGMGWLLIAAESFPLLLFVSILMWKRGTLVARKTIWLSLAFATFATLQFAIGGMRGSRSNTVWPLLIAAAIVHLSVRKIPSRVMASAAVAVVIFMFGYGLYKGEGTKALGVLDGTQSLSSVTAQTGRDYRFLLLEDLGRTGVQGLVVDRYMRYPQSPALGRSYIGDLSILVPQNLLPKADRPPSKVEYGTDVLYGPGATAAGIHSSRIYGLGGEAMLNFGFFGLPPAYWLFGMLVRRASRFYRSARRRGSPMLKIIAGTLGVFCLMAMVSDLDNLIWFTVKQVVLVVAVAVVARWLASKHTVVLSAGATRSRLIRRWPWTRSSS